MYNYLIITSSFILSSFLSLACSGWWNLKILHYIYIFPEVIISIYKVFFPGKPKTNLMLKVHFSIETLTFS